MTDEIIAPFMNSVFQPKHYWYFGLGHTFLWGMSRVFQEVYQHSLPLPTNEHKQSPPHPLNYNK